MATLYVRDVPSDVADVLKKRAATEGMSLSAYVVAELSRVAARATNTAVVARLRDRERGDGPSTTEILDALTDTRR
jgi:plasmid stability protein